MGGTKFYAGIGSRETPPDIQTLMMTIAIHMRNEGYTLRSGGAMGADAAFHAGARPECEIWRPQHATHEAIVMAAQFHPAWNLCSSFAKMLHGRNSHIVMGSDLETPVEVVICWTKDGEATGGAGQGLRIAEHFGIPIHNLFFPQVKEHYERLRPWQQLKLV